MDPRSRRPLLRLRAGLLAVALLFAPAAPSLALDPVEAVVAKEVTAADAQTVDRLLAGPRFLGRGTGQKGNEDAAAWLASELRTAGFGPGAVPASGDGVSAVDGDYLQWFDLPPPRSSQQARESRRSANVIGVLRGTGRAPEAGGTATPRTGTPVPAEPPPAETPPAAEAKAPEEFVVLGAHFDHLGWKGDASDAGKAPKKGDVFWGADDNASGTTAVLLVARVLGRLAAQGIRPRRTVIVMFFSGEEMGLLGSKHYCGSPVFPLDATAAMINLDMVGRNATKYLEVYGNTSSPELEQAHREVLEGTKFDCKYPGGPIFTRSDHYSFYEKKVPVIMLHGGLHKDYHTQRDTPDQINFPKVALVARHAFGVLWRVLNAEKRPTYREVDMSGAGGRLGLAVEAPTPEEHAALGLSTGTGVRVITVFSGSLGERLFQSGDLVYSWNGFPLHADDPVGRFNAFVNAARPGDSIVIRFVRGKERKAVTVKF